MTVSQLKFVFLACLASSSDVNFHYHATRSEPINIAQRQQLLPILAAELMLPFDPKSCLQISQLFWSIETAITTRAASLPPPCNWDGSDDRLPPFNKGEVEVIPDPSQPYLLDDGQTEAAIAVLVFHSFPPPSFVLMSSVPEPVVRVTVERQEIDRNAEINGKGSGSIRLYVVSNGNCNFSFKSLIVANIYNALYV